MYVCARIHTKSGLLFYADFTNAMNGQSVFDPSGGVERRRNLVSIMTLFL